MTSEDLRMSHINHLWFIYDATLFIQNIAEKDNINAEDLVYIIPETKSIFSP